MKFKIGDGVIYVRKYKGIGIQDENPYGLRGTIVSVRDSDYGVHFPGFKLGHYLAGEISKGEGWYCSEANLKLAVDRSRKDVQLEMDIGD